MKDATAALGTSLEVLAPYLPYGLVLGIDYNPNKIGLMHHAVGRAELTGLHYNHLTHAALLGQEMKQPYSSCLPLLRPFNQLCSPLEDGAIPAVEVAKLVGGSTSEWKVRVQKLGSILLQTDDGALTYHLVIKHIIRPEWGWHFSISTYPGKRHIDPLNIGAAYDYLRSKHFALPVNGRPLIEGVDFIAKAPAGPLTIQEGKSDAL